MCSGNSALVARPSANPRSACHLLGWMPIWLPAARLGARFQTWPRYFFIAFSSLSHSFFIPAASWVITRWPGLGLVGCRVGCRIPKVASLLFHSFLMAFPKFFHTSSLLGEDSWSGLGLVRFRLRDKVVPIYDPSSSI